MYFKHFGGFFKLKILFLSHKKKLTALKQGNEI